jgi:hypothetical protein
MNVKRRHGSRMTIYTKSRNGYRILALPWCLVVSGHGGYYEQTTCSPLMINKISIRRVSMLLKQVAFVVMVILVPCN